MELCECTMHIACFHLVVTSLFCIRQPCKMFYHQVCVVEHLFHVSWWQCCLCPQPVITKVDEVACCFEKRLMLFESLRDGIIRICLSEPFESCNDLLSMVCVWNASVEDGSAIGTSLIQHSLLECTCSVFCFTQCMSTKPLFWNQQCLWPMSSWHRHGRVVVPVWHGQPWGVVCCRQDHSTRTLSHSSPTHTVHMMVLVLWAHSPQWAQSWCAQWVCDGLAVLWPRHFFFPAIIISSYFSKQPFFSLPLLHGCLEMKPLDELYDFYKIVIFFLLIPVADGLCASFLWSLNGTVFLLRYCLCHSLRCGMYILFCSITIMINEWYFMFDV